MARARPQRVREAGDHRIVRVRTAFGLEWQCVLCGELCMASWLFNGPCIDPSPPDRDHRRNE